jgi:hypothetical protein
MRKVSAHHTIPTRRESEMLKEAALRVCEVRCDVIASHGPSSD